MYSSLRKQRGFSLIEILVATVLLLILLVPLFSFLKIGQASRSLTVRTTEVEQNARAALSIISRDIVNAGYNFAPKIGLGNTTCLSTLTGITPSGVNMNSAPIYPIIPGNDLNLVKTTNSSGATVTNLTDQITLIFVDQGFNQGLPLSGTLNQTGTNFTNTAAMLPTNLFVGDLVILAGNSSFAIAYITGIAGNVISFNVGDAYSINTGQAATLNPSTFPILPALPPPVTLYKFSFLTYFVDSDGNLIRRQKLPSPHTSPGGNNSRTTVMLTANSNPDPGCTGTCYYDNVIATGIEDLQFTYLVTDPGNTGVIGPVPDPGFYGAAVNLGTAVTDYRLLDIREVNVSLKARAFERDNQIKDPHNSQLGYIYRFSADATVSTMNLYIPKSVNVPFTGAVGP